LQKNRFLSVQADILAMQAKVEEEEAEAEVGLQAE
jgi:hypothetical protein